MPPADTISKPNLNQANNLVQISEIPPQTQKKKMKKVTIKSNTEEDDNGTEVDEYL